MKILVTIAISIVLSSCYGYEPPDYEDLKTSFSINKSTYSELVNMISEDTASGNCGSVSDNHIKGWWEYSGLWNTNQDYANKVELAVVLSDVGISEYRYKLYLKKLSSVGASEGVSHCNDVQAMNGTNSTFTRFGMSASGLAVSGCITEIIHRGNMAIPENEKTPSYFYDRVPIDEYWYIEHGCT